MLGEDEPASGGGGTFETVGSGDGFHDYTVPTAWERLVATLEGCLHNWTSKDIPSLLARGREPHLAATLHHRLPLRSHTYTLTLHLSPGGPPSALCDRPHRLQEWFGAGPVLVLAPDSHSGRVLDGQEANTLLSAVAAALAHQRLEWPLILPVHDSLRDGQRGIAVAGGAVVHFESDSVHSRQLPEGLMHTEALLRLLQTRLGGRCPAAAAALEAALAGSADTPPAALAELAGGAEPPGGATPISIAVRSAYALPDAASAEEKEGAYADGREAEAWDRAAPWRRWVCHADPVGCLEVDLVGRYSSAAAAMAADLKGLDLAAVSWRLSGLAAHHRRDDGHRGFLLQAVDIRRRFLSLQPVPPVAGAGGGGGSPRGEGQLSPSPAELPGDSSFYGLLSTAAESTRMVLRAHAVGQLADVDWWPEEGESVPRAPASGELQDALRDVFCAPALPAWPGDAPSGAASDDDDEDGASGRWDQSMGKAAPLQSLASRLALHALHLGTPRAVAMLWDRFLRELRFVHWDARIPLPRMPPPQPGGSSATGGAGAPPPPDLRCGLLHQKLQLINLCIAAQNAKTGSAGSGSAGAAAANGGQRHVWEEEDGPADGPGSPAGSDSGSYHSINEASDRSASPGKAAAAAAAAERIPSPRPPPSSEPQGVAAVLPGAFLLEHPSRPLNVPVTQDPAPCTEDTLAEREAALLASGGDRAGAAARAALQGSGLLSDMAAFKAANPGCCLSDFVRWHSPRDWVREGAAPGRLSERMAAPGNAWQLLWGAAAPAPVSAQRPLFSPLLEGERALHFLETLPPAALYSELLALGLSAAVSWLGHAAGARLPAVRRQLDRLRDQVDVTLQSGLALCPGGWASSSNGASAASAEAEGGQRTQSVLHGLYSSGAGLEAFTELVLRLGCAEQTVVAAQSLLQRLTPADLEPSASGASDGDLAAALDASEAARFAERAADGLVAAALGEREAGLHHGATVSVASPEGRTALAALLRQGLRREGADGSEEEEEEEEAAAGEGGRGGASPWPAPFQTEWLVQVASMASLRQQQQQQRRRRQEEGVGGSPTLPHGQGKAGGPGHPAGAAGSGWGWGGAQGWAHRVYLKSLPAELRIATVISCDL